jgi:plastocyanin
VKVAIGFLILISFSIVLSMNDSFALLSSSAYTLEGSGFAVTKETIKISQIDLALSTQDKIGSTIKSSIEDGFITLDGEDFLATELVTTILREGKYIRINGIVENETGDELSIRIFGRLVEESKNASVYSFSGRVIASDKEYTIIYTTKLSELIKFNVIPTESKNNETLTVHILKNSSTQGAESYIGLPLDSSKFKYFSQDRISIKPGMTITIVNDDVVSHSILSGKENYYDRYNQFTPDGRISTGEILPGKSVTIKLNEEGFYRLYDPDYQWMKIVAYVFPDVDNVILGQGKNPGN